MSRILNILANIFLFKLGQLFLYTLVCHQRRIKSHVGRHQRLVLILITGKLSDWLFFKDYARFYIHIVHEMRFAFYRQFFPYRQRTFYIHILGSGKLFFDRKRTSNRGVPFHRRIYTNRQRTSHFRILGRSKFFSNRKSSSNRSIAFHRCITTNRQRTTYSQAERCTIVLILTNKLVIQQRNFRFNPLFSHQCRIELIVGCLLRLFFVVKTSELFDRLFLKYNFLADRQCATNGKIELCTVVLILADILFVRNAGKLLRNPRCSRNDCIRNGFFILLIGSSSNIGKQLLLFSFSERKSAHKCNDALYRKRKQLFLCLNKRECAILYNLPHLT